MVLCFAAFQYHRERRFKAEELNSRLQILNKSLLAETDHADTAFRFDSLPAIEGLRVSVIDLQGRVIYDNSLDSLPAENHLEREEIAGALAKGSGYTIRRHSESTGETYFYSARKGNECIVRTAVPYSVSLRILLQADYGFLWFMIGVTSVMSLLGYFATRRVGLHVSRLNRFAEKAERGERIFDTDPFPHDELGDISNHIVRLYAQLQEAIADRDRQHRLALHEEQEKIRIKKQLTNNINHELKTPVAAMQVCLETLMTHKELAPEKRDEFIARCYANSERLKNLLADVSLITRMDDGAMPSPKTKSICRRSSLTCVTNTPWRPATKMSHWSMPFPSHFRFWGMPRYWHPFSAICLTMRWPIRDAVASKYACSRRMKTSSRFPLPMTDAESPRNICLGFSSDSTAWTRGVHGRREERDWGCPSSRMPSCGTAVILRWKIDPVADCSFTSLS